MPNLKTITLCADDFGLNPNISLGIINLVCLKHLSAVSCMTNMPDFITFSDELKKCQNQEQIGLHFNLTEGHFVSEPEKKCYSLNELLIKTHLRLYNESFFVREFKAQLENFVKVMGFYPHFVDGHQHVHQFPGVREAILLVYEQELRKHKTYIRVTYPSINVSSYRFKAFVLALTGGKAMSGLLNKLDIPHNHYFSGVYDFSPRTDYPALMKEWLSRVEDNTLIMCHPSQGLTHDDAIGLARVQEYEYFLSEKWVWDYQDAGCRIYRQAQNLETT